MKVKPLVTLTLVHQFNFFVIIFIFACSPRIWGGPVIIEQDQAIARFGSEVVFKSEIELLSRNLNSISCLKASGLIFHFIPLNLKPGWENFDYSSKNNTLNELVLLKKAIVFSNDFNTPDNSPALKKELVSCNLPSYEQWSHTLKELISFEIYLRDRFSLNNDRVGKGGPLEKHMASFKSSVIQRDTHEWLIP